MCVCVRACEKTNKQVHTLLDQVVGEDAAEGDVLLRVGGRAVGRLLPVLVHAPVVEPDMTLTLTRARACVSYHV